MKPEAPHLRRFFFAGKRVVVVADDLPAAEFDAFHVMLYTVASSGCASPHDLFFLQKFMEKFGPEKPPAAPGLLRLRKNPTKICTRRKIWYTVYIRDEEEKSSWYIRRIRRRKNSFLCLNAAAACSGICVFLDKEFSIL